MIQNPVIRSLYQEQGFLIRRNVFSEFEIQELATEVERVLLEHADAIRQTNLRVRFKNHCTTQEPMFEVFDPFSDLSEVARSVARHPQLLTILESLYGETACVFKDKLIYKPPGAEGVSLHQDWIAWPDFPQSFLTAIIPIDPFTEDSGATCVYPGLHKAGCLSAKDGQHHVLKHEDMDVQPVPLVLNPGDIAIINGFLPHYSEPNKSGQWRRGYFVSYNAASDGGEQWSKHYAEFHNWILKKLPEDRRASMSFI